MLLTPLEIKELDRKDAEYKAAYQRLIEAMKNNIVLLLDDETLRAGPMTGRAAYCSREPVQKSNAVGWLWPIFCSQRPLVMAAAFTRLPVFVFRI